ncbi:type II toxin-antitoxin system RelE/ParE family toxin [soil metagenome]
MFTLNTKPCFDRELNKLLKKQPELAEQVRLVLVLLQANPRDPRLKSHKATDSDGNPVFSVEVTGDIRIAWDYGEPGVIDLLRVGGHSGSKKVYR